MSEGNVSHNHSYTRKVIQPAHCLVFHSFGRSLVSEFNISPGRKSEMQEWRLFLDKPDVAFLDSSPDEDLRLVLGLSGQLGTYQDTQGRGALPDPAYLKSRPP